MLLRRRTAGVRISRKHSDFRWLSSAWALAAGKEPALGIQNPVPQTETAHLDSMGYLMSVASHDPSSPHLRPRDGVILSPLHG